MIYEAILQGFLLSGGLIIAIGSQNAFLLSQSLKSNHEWLIATICFVSDAILILLGIFGFSALLKQYPSLINYTTILGAIFLFIYGLLAFRNAFKRNTMQTENEPPLSATKAISITLALTFLNPHVYLDTIVLLGSIANSKFPDTQFYFGLGAATASFVWFYGLTIFAKVLIPLFKKPRTWQVLDILIGITMWAIAISLIKIM